MHGQRRVKSGRIHVQCARPEIGPIARQQVVIKQIHQYATDSPARRTDPLAAANKRRMPIGKAVNRPMQGHTGRQIWRQTGRQMAFDEIAKQTANAIGIFATGKQGMGKKIDSALL